MFGKIKVKSHYRKAKNKKKDIGTYKEYSFFSGILVWLWIKCVPKSVKEFIHAVKILTIRVLKLTAVGAVVLGILAGSYYIGKATNTETIFEFKEKEVLVDNLPAKVDELKNDIVARLRKCESGSYKESDGIIILDSNDKMSFGLYQFQKKTVQHYEKVLYGKDITPKEAVLIALDEKQSTELAKDILFKVDKGSNNWLNCSKKLGLESEIAIIKKLEK